MKTLLARGGSSFLVLAGVLAVLAVPTGVAHAGGCPTCSSSAECVDQLDGGLAFCVVHDNPVGCGSVTTLCCPGQGCAIGAGSRPTCEGTTCHVIDAVDAGAGTDAAVVDTDTGVAETDAGGAGTDAGGAGTDAGATGTDAGGTGNDAGGAGNDAGTSTGMDGGTSTPASSGCGCSAVGSRGPTGAALLALGLGALVAGRRARRRVR